MDITHILQLPSTWVIVCGTTASLIYWFGTRTFTYFSRQGIPGPKPLPFVGNLWGIWKKNLSRQDMELMKKYGKTVGTFDGRTPNLFTVDDTLIRSIFIRDFDHFLNRRSFEIKSRVLRNVLSLIRDQKWKDIRSSVSPAFTTGKIKRMSSLMRECADKLSKKLGIMAKTSGKMDAKIQFSAYTMDVIARCTFGMNIDHLGEKGDPFTENATIIFNNPLNKTPAILLPFTIPQLNAILPDSVIIPKEFRFFINVVEDLIRQRANTQEKFNDFAELATESILEMVRSHGGSSGNQWNREEIDEIVIAQCLQFLLAGFDTTGTTLTNICYMLARHPDVQDKLYSNIMEKIQEFGDVTHECLLNLPYLDQVINEVLRILPPVLRAERECSKDITYGDLHIKKGTIITIPIYALHHMEEHYPNPEHFDPERWAPGRKSEVSNYTFMPFGMGPRNCIGMRFAMEEIKIAVCTILKEFRFFSVKETPEHLQMEDGFLIVSQPTNAIVGIEIRS